MGVQITRKTVEPPPPIVKIEATGAAWEDRTVIVEHHDVTFGKVKDCFAVGYSEHEYRSGGHRAQNPTIHGFACLTREEFRSFVGACIDILDDTEAGA